MNATKVFESIAQFLHQSVHNKDFLAIKCLHGNLIRTTLLFSSLNIHKTLIFSYASCLDHNHRLGTLNKFLKSLNRQNSLPLNLIISHFAGNGFPFLSLAAFSFMHSNGLALDTYSLCSSLTASSNTKDGKSGQQSHAYVIKSGWLSSVFVGSALVDKYSKLGFTHVAAKVFDEIPEKNTVCANALLAGFCEAKLWNEALGLARKMPSLSLLYDNFTVAEVLRACAGLNAIELGKQIHAFLFRKVQNFENDMFLLSSLIETYGRCGLVDKASRVFYLSGLKGGEKKWDIVLWTSMLGVYGRNGRFEEAFEFYNKMLMAGIKPDQVAFLTILSACAHTGRIKLGISYFESMIRDYNLIPGQEHYSCLVDVLCRAGELDKAWSFISGFVYGDSRNGKNCNVSMWGALLRACMDKGNIELGKMAAKKALELEPENAGVYMMLSNLYANFGMWDEIHELREEIKQQGMHKDVAQSWIQVAA